MLTVWVRVEGKTPCPGQLCKPTAAMGRLVAPVRPSVHMSGDCMAAGQRAVL